jgi:hypothetical protein
LKVYQNKEKEVNIAQRRDNKIYKIEYNEVLLQADLTARQYQTYLGLDTLPRLLKRNLDNPNRSINSKNFKDVFHLTEDFYYTGKIIISLSARSICNELNIMIEEKI